MNEYERKKAVLSRYLALQRSISGYGEELAKWATIGTKINQSYQEGIGAGENTSKPENAGINLAEIKKCIIKDLDTCMLERDSIKKVIGEAPSRYREILVYRYINGFSVGAIADLMEKDERSVKRIVKDATLSVKI